MTTYEHRQEIVPGGPDFPAWLDQQSARGWEILHISVVGAQPVRAAAAAASLVIAGQQEGLQVAYPLNYIILRRPNPTSPPFPDARAGWSPH